MKKGDLYVLSAAFIWGFCLVGQASGMKYMGPLSFTSSRLLLGAISMIPFIIAVDLKKKKVDQSFSMMQSFRDSFKPALVCAPFFIAPILFQQVGLQFTSVGKCAFITALYIFMVPLLGMFLGKKMPKKTWMLVLMAMVGLYMITMASGFEHVNKGDIIVLGAALTYSIQLLIVEKAGSDDNMDGIKFSTLQFLFGALIALVLALIFEPGQITMESLISSAGPIVITGVFSCAVGYTLQFLGFLQVESTRGSLILSSETIFSLLAGFLILKEVFRPIEYLGCLLMIIAIVLSVLPESKGKSH